MNSLNRLLGVILGLVLLAAIAKCERGEYDTDPNTQIPPKEIYANQSR